MSYAESLYLFYALRPYSGSSHLYPFIFALRNRLFDTAALLRLKFWVRPLSAALLGLFLVLEKHKCIH